jgi:hypothetical protein
MIPVIVGAVSDKMPVQLTASLIPTTKATLLKWLEAGEAESADALHAELAAGVMLAQGEVMRKTMSAMWAKGADDSKALLEWTRAVEPHTFNPKTKVDVEHHSTPSEPELDFSLVPNEKFETYMEVLDLAKKTFRERGGRVVATLVAETAADIVEAEPDDA